MLKSGFMYSVGKNEDSVSARDMAISVKLDDIFTLTLCVFPLLRRLSFLQHQSTSEPNSLY